MKKFLSEINKTMNKVLDKGATFAGIAAAKYHSYLEEENQKAREAAAFLQKEQISEQIKEDYLFVAELLQEAINNTAEITQLRTVKKISTLYNRPWYYTAREGYLIFKYHGWYTSGVGTSTRDVQRILQKELNRICNVSNIPKVYIRVALKADGIIKFGVAAASDVEAAKNAPKIKI